MRVLIVGSGGREHALAWKLAQSPHLTKLFCTPGNPGIGNHAELIAAGAGSVSDIADWAKENEIDLVVVGPEIPLAEGIADCLHERGVPVFGPDRKAARIESSKVFAKELMDRHGIPTAEFVVCDTVSQAEEAIRQFTSEGKQVVVKADGLAAGKGAIVTKGRDEALEAVRRVMVDRVFGSAGDRVVIEERLRGPETSILALTDGEHLVVLPPSQDHKPIGEGDTGLNTGGMGAYSPVPLVDDSLLNRIVKTILRPTIRAMKLEGCPYRGTLYAGLMIVNGDPYVIEFNCRFGDPETQAALPVVEEDLLPLLKQSAEGNLGPDRIVNANGTALCVVMASGGYPESYETGKSIEGLENDLGEGIVVFHAGTAMKDGRLVTAGGRVLGVTGVGRDFREAAKRANQGTSQISFDKAYYRHDIGYRVLGVT
ncbi:MAG TPA: phosphoribosylamine--glycine ligase [bacterium]|nr:phosphoribosylamine--glycine ligase [bacterium]HQL63566.1 phosphoribosylamine--glycine ligase [bacterium]